MFDKILAVFAPHNCIQCGLEGSLWCVTCRSNAPPAADRCYRCHQLSDGGRTCRACRRRSALFSVQAVTRYDAEAKQLVWKLKFEGAQAAADLIAGMMAATLGAADGMVITHAPTASSHIRIRGYDQARLIALGLAKRAALPLLPCLVRVGQQQQRNASRAQRMVQLAQAFRVSNLTSVRGEHILLVDDVITTGATLEAAAATLKAAGAKRVSALVFAQA